MKHSTALLLLILLATVSCQTINDNNFGNQAILYQQSIVDAMSPDSAKIYSNLVTINKQNNNLKWKTINGYDYLLVVTWKQNISYFKPYLDSAFYNTGAYPIWITTAPELKNRINQTNQKILTFA